ncbi:hypothetical protein [Streptomyces sp. LN325]|uniref:hypothetical protein n=1 Tax=Streptomyces sp. LN325 TaxID=3112976 RepID=UPI00371A9710
MLALIGLALIVLALVLWRAMDKVKEDDVAPIVRFALIAIVTLVLTYVAMRLAPPDAVTDLLRQALRVLRA